MGWDGKNISFCFHFSSPPLSLSVSSSTSCPFLSQPTASLLHSLLSSFLIYSLSLKLFLSQLAATTQPPLPSVPSSPFLSPSLPLYLLHTPTILPPLSFPHTLLPSPVPPSRKYTLLLNNVMVWVGVGLQSLAVHPAMFIAGRFTCIMGVNSGIYMTFVHVRSLGAGWDKLMWHPVCINMCTCLHLKCKYVHVYDLRVYSLPSLPPSLSPSSHTHTHTHTHIHIHS